VYDYWPNMATNSCYMFNKINFKKMKNNEFYSVYKFKKRSYRILKTLISKDRFGSFSPEYFFLTKDGFERNSTANLHIRALEFNKPENAIRFFRKTYKNKIYHYNKFQSFQAFIKKLVKLYVDQ
jgi:hypothetical protein